MYTVKLGLNSWETLIVLSTSLHGGDYICVNMFNDHGHIGFFFFNLQILISGISRPQLTRVNKP